MVIFMTLITLQVKSQTDCSFNLYGNNLKLEIVNCNGSTYLLDSLVDIIFYDTTAVPVFTSLNGRQFVKCITSFPTCADYGDTSHILPNKYQVSKLYNDGIKLNYVQYLYNDIYVTKLKNNDYAIFKIDSCYGMLMFRIFYNLIEIKPQVCIVSVDTSSWKNKIIWEKTPNFGISSYNIYKETGANVYDSIGNVPYNNESFFIDYSSDPQHFANKYKISAIDSLGEKSQISFYHKVIMLSLNSGYGSNNVNMSWTSYKDESGEFIPNWYYIYRGLSTDSMFLLDSISGGDETYLYNDNNVTSFYYYMVGVKKPNGCNTGNKYIIDGSFSNEINTNSNGISDAYLNESNIILYPNPTNDHIYINTGNYSVMTGYLIKITNSLGQTVFQNPINQQQFYLDLSTWAGNGIYFIHILDNKGNNIAVKKIILQ